MAKENKRVDHIGPQRTAYEKQRRILLRKRPQPCPICGQEINYNLKAPDPGAPVVDHIIPISRGGHPSDPDNLQVTHARCNAKKGDRLQAGKYVEGSTAIPNNVLPWSIDWTKYRGSWPPEDSDTEE